MIKVIIKWYVIIIAKTIVKIKVISFIPIKNLKQDGSFVDMGGTFDFFGEESHPDYKKLTKKQKKNRKILRDAMLKAGFKPIDSEWWHFTLKDEPYPDTYFDFDVEY